METIEKTAEQTATVNFLDFGQKTTDWRYLNSCNWGSNRNYHDYKTIYWIGTLTLMLFDEKNTSAPLSFVTGFGSLCQDSYQKRREDGSSAGESIPVEYFFNTVEKKWELVNYILEKKKVGYTYLHFFLEEKVNGYGKGEVNILFYEPTEKELEKNNRKDEIIFGVPSHVSLINERLQDCYSFSKQEITSSLKRICIINYKDYNWMK